MLNSDEIKAVEVVNVNSSCLNGFKKSITKKLNFFFKSFEAIVVGFNG